MTNQRDSLVPAETWGGRNEDLQSSVMDVQSCVKTCHSIYSASSYDTLSNSPYYETTTDATPAIPLTSLPSQSTSELYNTSAFARSSEYKDCMGRVLEKKVGPVSYVNAPDFFKTYFRDIVGLEPAAEAVFEKCQEPKGDDVLYQDGNGWKTWPSGAMEPDVSDWLVNMRAKFLDLSKDHQPVETQPRTIRQDPKPLPSNFSSADKLDIGFFNTPNYEVHPHSYCQQVMVPGVLMRNQSSDIASKAWLNLGAYAAKVLATQDTRRFVLGFTLCGADMRLWLFDRAGAVTSTSFDINQQGLLFVAAALGFMWMNDEQLGFDPGVKISHGKRYIEIQRQHGNIERVFLDAVIYRAQCLNSRGTTCWKGHIEGKKGSVVIKESWQHPELEDEGKLLQEATEEDVVNVARYHHHETVLVNGVVDDTRNNVRKGCGMAKEGTCSDLRVEPLSNVEIRNKVRRRVIIKDYGKPIHKSTSPIGLLSAMEDCIMGHRSLLERTGILHRDISPGNLMIPNEDMSRPAFLIDLDRAGKEYRNQGKNGTRIFMAIDLLVQDHPKHSLLHDLESFFWVLFWICIQSSHHQQDFPEFDQWDKMDNFQLGLSKSSVIGNESVFLTIVTECVKEFYSPLVPCLNMLRKVVFDENRMGGKEGDFKMYDRIAKVLQDSRMVLEGFAGTV